MPTTCDCDVCRHAGPPASYAEGADVDTFHFADEPARLGRRRFLSVGLSVAGLAAIGAAAAPPAFAQRPGASAAQAAVRASVRRLALYNEHTGESFNDPIAMNGRFIPAALGRINVLMRDHSASRVARIDPRLIDLLSRIQGVVRRPLHLISGYRSWQTNEWLRQNSSSVAENSFHIRGMAADFFVEGARPSALARIARTLGAGGVGMYRGDPYIHVDTGPRRSWFY